VIRKEIFSRIAQAKRKGSLEPCIQIISQTFAFRHPLQLVGKSMTIFKSKLALLPLCLSYSFFAQAQQIGSNNMEVFPETPVTFSAQVEGISTKRINLDVNNLGAYATLSIFADDELIADNINVPSKGQQQLSVLVNFNKLGDVSIKIKSLTSTIIVNSIKLEDVYGVTVPQFKDISEQAGIDKVSSLKYAGPTVADINNNGFYDFVVNNHNDVTSKLYWNNGDGTVTKHHKDLSRWTMHDLHGTSFGDYDGDGHLDMILAQGGGNGRNPATNNFYKNNNSEFVLYTGDVGIEKGARGRGSKWGDFNQNGKLDFVMINEMGLFGETPQHHFYENVGDGKFELKTVPGIETEQPERALVTDLNNDGIDDIILYGHRHSLSVWLGNGDFTFTDITEQFPQELRDSKQISAVVDLDINNNGMTDLYFARGKEFEHGRGEATSVDFDPELKQFSIKPRPYHGSDRWEFTADGPLKLDNYYFLGQNGFRHKDYPIYLGKDKVATNVTSGSEFEFSAEDAEGWPEDTNKNGVYFGHLGNGKWKAALVRKGDIFWAYKFNLTGVTSYELDFVPENRNLDDVLLRNDGDAFVDVSREWSIPKGGNAQGVITGDFNNNGQQDLLIYRWGNVNHRISDLMLLNNKDRFEAVTMHGASDFGGPGYGDMGQSFDFNLNGNVDILSGSEFGEWYLYSNQTENIGNYALVRVGYSPRDNVDPISAKVRVKTANGEWQKRVGSTGEVFSQSLLNTVHFGLGSAEKIESIVVTWRNGETAEFNNKSVNKVFFTDELDPTRLEIVSAYDGVRENTSMPLNIDAMPHNADASVTWSSSNDNVVSVDADGIVTATGSAGQSAVITARSTVSETKAEKTITVAKWIEKPIEALSLVANNSSVVVGQSVAIESSVEPIQPDNSHLEWTSSNPQVAVVDNRGVVTGVSAGDVDIVATSSANSAINDSVSLTVEPFIEGFVHIHDSEKYATQPIVLGENMTIELDYHAGTDNKVIFADEGGVRVWLRHFQRKWLPQRDIVLVESDAIDTVSGTYSYTIPLDGVKPTSELPEGHFYSLRATFTASDGTMHDHEIYPLNFVNK
jgi:hypothetical protein